MNCKNVILLGGIVIDSYIVVDSYPEKGQDTIISNTFEKVGGCPVNVGYTLKNLGAEAYIVSSIGEDDKGKNILSYLIERNIKTDCIVTEKNGNTGYCNIILENSSERTFMTYLGCEGKFAEEMIPEKILKNTEYIYLTGNYLAYKKYQRSVLDFIKSACKRGIKLVFDPGALIGYLERNYLKELLGLTSILIPNREEIKLISDILNLNDDFYRWCDEAGIEIVLNKAGENGVEVWTKNELFTLSAYSVEYKDGTGAGDSFAGGFLYGMLNKFDMKKTAKIASACGALTTTFVEPHGDFTLKDIYNIIES